MRVLSVAFSEIPVGAASSGGAEQILALLDAGLIERGHQSVVIAAPGSRASGQLVESSDHRAAIYSVLADHPVDLIHFHGLEFHRYLPVTETPMHATLHLPVPLYPAQMIDDCRSRGITLNCVSENQAGSSEKSWELPVIPNGVPTNVFVPLDEQPSDYVLWLGRICPEKGAHIALRIAHRHDMRLIVAGPVQPYPEHERYFHNSVEPLFDDRRTYFGAADLEAKRRLLAGARCLLVPSLVAETSSLVTMEALSCGTPVIAFRKGALPEVVDHGRTGFIVDGADEMAAAVHEIPRLSRAVCREQACKRFDSVRMVEDYLALYRRMITRRFSSACAPHRNL